MTAFCPRMETIHWMSPPPPPPPSAKNSLLQCCTLFLCYSAYILQLALPPVLSFSMSSSQFVFQFMHATYVRTYVYHTRTRELNGLMFARDHMNRCEKSASLIGTNWHVWPQLEMRNWWAQRNLPDGEPHGWGWRRGNTQRAGEPTLTLPDIAMIFN